MVTERGAALLIASAFAWLLGRFLGVPELYVLAAAAASLVALGLAAVWLSGVRLSARRGLAPERIAWGGRSRVVLELRNTGRLPTGTLLVHDETSRILGDAPRFVVPGLRRRGAVRLAYEAHGNARGRYPVGPVHVRVRDPYGLAERGRLVGEPTTLVVYPRVEPLAGGVPLAPRQGGGGRQRRSLLHAGDEFSTVREWAPGDDIRLVHWPSTAHRARLMVRQFEQPLEPEVTLLVDTRAAVHSGAGPVSTMETAITAAASVAHHLDGQRQRMRLHLPDDRLPPASEPLPRVMDRLAEADAAVEESLGPVLGRCAATRAGGLLVAVLAPPPVDDPAAMSAHPDVRALVSATRGYSVRTAFVVDTVARANARRPADLFARTLAAAGWRTATLRPGTPVTEAWGRLAPAGVAAGGAR